MAITSKGFAGGPMTDDDFGAIAARAAWVESAAAWAVSQPSTGTRTLSIAAGNAVAHGVRVISDAAISQAVTAPGSGGQWYLLVLRRDWTAGQKVSSLQVLSAASTGSTTTPTAPPSALPATFQSSPGSAQADQPLAWVWTSSASTTLTIFDVRVIDTRSRGVLAAATFWTLQMLGLVGAVQDGATMPLLPQLITGALGLKQSIWHRQNGQWSPLRGAAWSAYGDSQASDLVTLGTYIQQTIQTAIAAQLNWQWGQRILGDSSFGGMPVEATWSSDNVWEISSPQYVGMGTGIGYPGASINDWDTASDGFRTRATRTGVSKSASVQVLLNLKTTQSITPGTTVCTLPAGFRPAQRLAFMAEMLGSGNGGWQGKLAVLSINPDGTVSFNGVAYGASNEAIASGIGLFGSTAFMANN